MEACGRALTVINIFLRYLGIIPARGGSKRFPRKNIALLNGKPLIAYTIEAAARAKCLAKIIVSTDNEEIAAIARQWGGDVPFLRPPALADDKSPVIGAINHALQLLEREDEVFDAVVLLQPTSPFRKHYHIDEAVARFETSGADTVTAVCLPCQHPYYNWTLKNEEMVPFFSMEHQAIVRQELPPALVENGSIYVVKRSLLASGMLYGSKIVHYLMDRHSSLDIDTQEDFHFAEFILSQVDNK